jgi:hypothetical protein
MIIFPGPFEAMVELLPLSSNWKLSTRGIDFLRTGMSDLCQSPPNLQFNLKMGRKWKIKDA